MSQAKFRQPRDCICGGDTPRCHVCLAAIVVGLRVAHPNSISVGMVRQKVPEITGREAAIAIELMRYMRW